MTTYTLNGYFFDTHPDDEDITITLRSVSLSVVMAPGKTSFSYTYDEPQTGEPTDISLNNRGTEFYGVELDGVAYDSDADLEADLVEVLWDDGGTTRTSYVLNFFNDGGGDYIFVIGGHPLPSFTSPAEFDVFDSTQLISAQDVPIGNAFAAGMLISLPSIPGVTISEHDEINGTSGDDMLLGGIGDDLIKGGEGDDLINPGDNVNYDLVLSGTGDDTIDMGDVVTGFIEIQHWDVSGSIDVTIDGNANTGSIDKGALGTTTLLDVENAILAGADIGGLGIDGALFDDTFNIRSADGGWMEIRGNQGADDYTFLASTGDLRLDFINANQGMVADFTTGTISNDGWGNAETVVGFEHVTEVRATQFADSLTGTDDDYESWILKGGDDTLDAGGGWDRLRFDRSGVQAVTVDLDAETASGTWNGNAFNASIMGIEEVRGSRAGNDTIRGSSGAEKIRTNAGDDKVYDNGGNDTIELGDGDDYVRVGGGRDSYDGGDGSDDYISYYDSSGGVDLDLEANTATGSWANNDTVVNFESVGGSKTGDDTISGTSGANRINTYGGDDRVYDRGGDDDIDLGSGDDYVRAGGGADTYDGGSGTDYISYYDSSGGVNLDFAANTASGSWASNDVVLNFESASGSKTGDDTINGTDGDNRINTYGGDDRVYDQGGDDEIDLGSGDDYVRAGGGADTYDGGSGTDYISYYDSSGGVNLDFTANTATGSWANNDVVLNFESASGSKTGDDTINGTDGDNRINTYGGDDRVTDLGGNDEIDLGSGDDYVRAGGGADTYDGGSGTDYISYYDSSGGVDLDFAANTATGAWANNDSVVNFEGASGSNKGDDTLRGTDGESILRGYGGDDRLHGRDGDDSLVGGSGDDSLYGGDGADTMRGGSGADRFDGGGGSGTDLLYGDSGADTFHFDRGEGDDVIKDFENNIDLIEFDNFSGFTTAADALAYATEISGDVFFDFGTDGTVLVENATIAQLMNDIDIV
ncbi:calcium-binding protein [Rhodobacteraceae bacterium KMM 6894]|nr:calcium-binding protein [Rhodobacteraceae bacterium KMM 6894]